MPVQPRTPPGVLELLPSEQLEHQRMLDTIRRGYERFGYLPVETPAFELSSVLLTKSGGETEKQVYFVQSSGALKQGDTPELALRFDLTVPLARYVAQHEHALNFPFRRYQIQRVYRGERNQKGRYREFYQCDIDVIAKDTLPLAYDAEIPAIIHGIFEELAFGAFTIRINNRKLLRGILESVGIAADRHTAVLHEVDRLGKQPRAEIEARMAGEGVGIAPAIATRLLDTLSAHAGDSAATLAQLRAFDNASPALREGLTELEEVYEGTLALGVPAARCVIDLSIVRGLDYYTGTVYETFLDDYPKLGSICSGGRYENLAGHYTKSKLPGVGISIGATRLFSQLREIGRAVMDLIAGKLTVDDVAKQQGVPAATVEHWRTAALAGQLPCAKRRAISEVVVLNLEPELRGDVFAIAKELRAAGFNVEVYGGQDKLAKQLKYADHTGAPFALFYGKPEREAGVVKLKDFRVTTERAPDIAVPRDAVVERLRSLLDPASAMR